MSNEELEEKIEDLEDDIRGLKYELEEKDSVIEDLKEEVQDLKEELEEEKREHGMKVDELDRISEELERISQELKERITELERTITDSKNKEKTPVNQNEIKKDLLKILNALENEGQEIFRQNQDENFKCQKTLNDRIVELEAELERRPVVYCYRNKHGELARHFGSGSLALWAKPEEHEATNPELEWKIEVYTGGEQP